MGLLGFVGKVASVAFNALMSTAVEANNVRKMSGHMSDRDLINGFRDKNSSVAQRAGYMQAYKDRHQKN